MEVFPTLDGLSIQARSTPRFNTSISTSSTGYEFRANLQQQPLWDWEVSFEFLRNRRDGIQDLETIQSFFLNRRGSYEAFLFNHRETSAEEGAALGTGNGVETDFLLIKTTGTFTEVAGGIPSESYLVLYNDGAVVDSADYTLVDHRTVRFNTAPTSGSAITADYTPLYRVRFSEDMIDFDNFMHQLWELNQLTLTGVFL